LDISNRKATKRAPTFIRCQDLEWPSAADAFTSRTVVFTATANKFAPITPLPMSIFSDGQLQARVQSGVIGVARRAITFSTGQR
jgi:hypothetical protein